MTDLSESESLSGAEKLEQDIKASSSMSCILKELLPQFQRILELLESGVFICAGANIKAYKEIARHHEAYSTLMEMIGHDLICHATGFYYLRPRETQTLSLRERQSAASIFALIEYLSDRGMPIESMITSEEPITETDIQLVYDQHAERLALLKMETLESFSQDGLKKLIETGVLSAEKTSLGKVEYTLGIPTYFYLDIARNISKTQAQKAESTASDELLDTYSEGA